MSDETRTQRIGRAWTNGNRALWTGIIAFLAAMITEGAISTLLIFVGVGAGLGLLVCLTVVVREMGRDS